MSDSVSSRQDGLIYFASKEEQQIFQGGTVDRAKEETISTRSARNTQLASCYAR